MGLTNTILFEYGRDAEGKISIVGDTPTVQIHDADQNLYMQQRGLQDALMVQIREEIGMPANGLSAWWYGADEVKILENIAGLENPDHVMLALQVAPSLDPGTQAMLDTFGKGTPEFRQSLHAALQNPEFRAKLLSQDGAKELTALLERGIPEVEGIAPEVMETATLSMATRILGDIATGVIPVADLDERVQAHGPDGTTIVIPKIEATARTYLQQEVTTAGVDAFIAENPGLTELSETLKAYPEVVAAIARAAEADPTVTPGIEQMVNGEGGLEIGQLKTMLEDPTQRGIFVQVMDSVAANPEVDFSHAVTLANQVKNNDFAGIKRSLDFMKIDSAALGNSQMMGMLGQFMESALGQKLMGFVEMIIDAIGVDGGINGLMASMGINFEVPTRTTGGGLDTAPEVRPAHVTAVAGVVEETYHPVMDGPRVVAAAPALTS